MKETKPQIGYTDALILMEALWRDSTGGATFTDLIATFDGFQKITLLQDDLASGLTCLESAGLIRFTGERVIPTEKARVLYSKIQEIRNSPDYGADPTRYGGEKLARIVASGATKAYEEFNCSGRLCTESSLSAGHSLAKIIFPATRSIPKSSTERRRRNIGACTSRLWRRAEEKGSIKLNHSI